MKFARTALLSAVDAAIDAHRAAYDRRVTAWEEYLAQHKADWLDKHAAAWRAAAATIVERLDAGEVITKADLPARSGYVETHEEPYRFSEGRTIENPGRYMPPADLLGVKATLSAVTDDVVTVAGLRQLGVTSATLQAVVATLGRLAQQAA